MIIRSVHVCGKEFGRLSNLKRHLLLHSKEEESEKEFVCDVCGKRYKRENSYQFHILKCQKPNKEPPKRAKSKKQSEPKVYDCERYEVPIEAVDDMLLLMMIAITGISLALILLLPLLLTGVPTIRYGL